MKTSNVLASVLFGSLVAAAPLDKRYYVTKTELVVETVVVYTTVWDNQPASTATAKATSEPGLFYEHPSSKAAEHTPAYTPPAPSSKYTPPPASSVAAEHTPAYTPPAPSSQYTPPPASPAAPQPSPVYTPPPAQVSSAAPAQTSASSGGYGGGGDKHHGDITVYDNTGDAGACGTPLTDDMPVVAIAKHAWNAVGGSTYNVQTGASTNSWCGKKITISYTHPSGETKTTDATIMDMCPGCAGDYDIDLSHKAWNNLGLTEITRLQADWWVS